MLLALQKNETVACLRTFQQAQLDWRRTHAERQDVVKRRIELGLVFQALRDKEVVHADAGCQEERLANDRSAVQACVGAFGRVVDSCFPSGSQTDDPERQTIEFSDIHRLKLFQRDVEEAATISLTKSSRHDGAVCIRSCLQEGHGLICQYDGSMPPFG